MWLIEFQEFDEKPHVSVRLSGGNLMWISNYYVDMKYDMLYYIKILYGKKALQEIKSDVRLTVNNNL